jgi:transcriptional regulator with XRE-family HTH domain
MGMTQSELAELVHRDIQSVGRWERNETVLEPTIDILLRQLAAERLWLALEGSITSLSQLARHTATQSQITIDWTPDAERPYAPAA